MAKTVNDILSSLHPRAAVSISNAQLFNILNNEVRSDLRYGTWSTFPADFEKTKLITPYSIGPPTGALAGSGAGNVDDGLHRWKVTFVTASTESNSGKRSEPVYVDDNTTDGQISLTAIPLGGTNVTSRKIYRQEDGVGDYKLVGTIADNTTTTHTDNIAASALGVVMPQAFALPTNFFDGQGMWDESGYSVENMKPVEGIDNLSKRFYWIENNQIQFDPNHPFNNKTLSFRYMEDIAEVSGTTDALPYPTYAHSRMVNVLAKGVSFFYLRNIDQPREVQYLENDYIAAKVDVLTGSIASSPV